MAGADKTVKVTLVAVASPYVKGTSEAAAATNKLGRDIDNVGVKSQAAEGKMGKLTGSMKGMGVAAGVVAGTALVSFMTDAVKAAGDLQQSVGGVDAVFKGTADSIHDFGKNSAEAVGLSTNEFNKLVTVTGAMLKNKGMADFTDQAIKLTQVGADLAAQFGGSTADAVGALNAALRGESDPIERYGISLNEAAIKAELAAKGLEGLEGAALDQAKAQARVDLIMRQSADAMGAFARESETLQGQQQRLNAEWENAKATLGQALLPVLTDVVSGLRGGVDAVVAVAGAWEKVPEPVKAAVAALIAFKLLRGPVGSAIGAMRTNLADLVTDLKATGGAMGGLRSAGKGMLGLLGGPWGAAITGAVGILGLFMQTQADAEAAAKSLTDTLDKQTGAFTDLTRVKIRDALMGDLSGADQKLLSDLGVSFTEISDAIMRGEGAQKDYQLWLSQLKKDNPEAAAAIAGLQDSIVRQGDAARAAQLAGEALSREETKVGDEAKAATPKLKGYEDVVGAIDQIARDAEQAQRDLASAMLAVAAAAGDADAAEIAYQESIDAANASAKEHGKTLNIGTEAGRANKTALLEVADAALQSAEANLRNGEGVDTVKVSMEKAREEFVRAAEKMGLSKDAAEKLATEYGLTRDSVDNLKGSMDEIPKEVVSKLTVETSTATQRLKYFKLMYDSIGNKQVTLSAVYQTQGFEAAQAYRNRFASGGYISGPGTATSDSIPAYLSNGEYVVKAAAVQKYGAHFFDGLNAMRFADGGHVSRMAAPSGVAIDYDRLAAAVGSSTAPTINAYNISDDAIQRALRDYEWRNRA